MSKVGRVPNAHKKNAPIKERVGFLNDDGSSKELEKLVDEKAGTITIRAARTEE